MEKIIETRRLILREVGEVDQEGLFDLDRRPEVHQYIGTIPLTDVDQALDSIRRLQKQYKENGIGRWAVIDKLSQEFLGWSGLKLWIDPLNNRKNIYELGYRFIPKYWGKGYATESAQAWANYAFEVLKLSSIDGSRVCHEHHRIYLQRIEVPFVDVVTDRQGLVVQVSDLVSHCQG